VPVPFVRLEGFDRGQAMSQMSQSRENSDTGHEQEQCDTGDDPAIREHEFEFVTDHAADVYESIHFHFHFRGQSIRGFRVNAIAPVKAKANQRESERTAID
jgi:hypothetical protein